MKKYKPVIRQSDITRKFSYEKGKVTLNFSLRIDIKQDLKDFLELLEAAVFDVKEEISKK